MRVKLTYVFETKDGFRYEREEPEEIKEIVEETYKSLNELAKNGDSVCFRKDYTYPFMPKASISACIDGTWRFYELHTEITPIQ